MMKIYARAESASVQLANKTDHSPLTQADLALHLVVIEGLARLTPDLLVVSEKDADCCGGGC